ncbi:MAG: energy transducer TonB [Bacteroidota bacterium]
MPDRPADLRREYRLHLHLGAAMALLVVLAAFSVPTPPPEEPVDLLPVDPEPLEFVDVPPTAEPPPPPPPPAPPPPQIVSDDAVLAETVEAFDIEAFEHVAPRRPAAPGPPAPPPPITPPALPTPPIEEPTDEGFFVGVEIEPTLIGGIEGLQSRVTYPELARRVGAQGTVFVQFIVERDGSVTDAAVLRSPHDSLSEAALDAIRASAFTPGVQQGVAVRVRYTVPVRFVLR